MAISATGPGKPYSKRPAGLTGAMVARGSCCCCWPGAKTCVAGMGAGREEVGVADCTVVVVVV